MVSVESLAAVVVVVVAGLDRCGHAMILEDAKGRCKTGTSEGTSTTVIEYAVVVRGGSRSGCLSIST